MADGYRSRIGTRLLLITLLVATPVRATGPDADLLSLMGTLQTLLHKAQLALDAGNPPLAAFYAHELEETAAAVAPIADYDGFPVGSLTSGMLKPALEQLTAALQRGESTFAALDTVIAQCNACHAVTDHAYIRIVRNPINPYAQDFAPR